MKYTIKIQPTTAGELNISPPFGAYEANALVYKATAYYNAILAAQTVGFTVGEAEKNLIDILKIIIFKEIEI